MPEQDPLVERFSLVSAGVGSAGRPIVEHLVRPDGVVEDPEAVDLHVESVAVGDDTAVEVLGEDFCP